MAERGDEDPALEDLLGVPLAKINAARLQRGWDGLLGQKGARCEPLLARSRDWLGVDFGFLLYDVTRTDFEGLAQKKQKAARGYSRAHRPDGQPVCLGLVVTPEGRPLAYEVFAGNRAAVTTLADIVKLMEDKYGPARRVGVLDRGLGSEDPLHWLRPRGAIYLVGTPKRQLKPYPAALLDPADGQAVRAGVEVKRVSAPEGGEPFILCRSPDRAAKEPARLPRQRDRLRGEWAKLEVRLREHPVADLEAVGRRVGRGLGQYPAAAGGFPVQGQKDARGRAGSVEITERAERWEWARLAHGAYLFAHQSSGERSGGAVALLSQAEGAFRTGKSDLHLRPVFHQKTERVEAHILVSFLSLALWRTLEQWMRAKGLGDGARQRLLELDELRSMDVVWPTREAGEIRLRVVAQPEKALAQRLAHCGLELPRVPKILENVVPKIAPSKTQPVPNQASILPG